jgi:hypothetical protein
MIDADLAAFVQERVGIHIGTRNQRFEPNGARALAVRVEQDGVHLLVYLAEIAAKRVLPDLEANGQAAVSFGRPIDDKACQIKGTFVSARSARPDEREEIAAQFQSFLANLEEIGIPPRLAERWATWPCMTIRLKATAIFTQTPGPGAGEPVK